MARRTWRELGRDLDTVVVEVWTYHDITWERTIIFFKELWKAIKGGRKSFYEQDRIDFMNRFKTMDKTDGKQE